MTSPSWRASNEEDEREDPAFPAKCMRGWPAKCRIVPRGAAELRAAANSPEQSVGSRARETMPLPKVCYQDGSRRQT
jgi:hypothetical protein